MTKLRKLCWILFAVCGLALAACESAPRVGGLSWPHGERDPAYVGMPGDPAWPYPAGQDKFDP